MTHTDFTSDATYSALTNRDAKHLPSYQTETLWRDYAPFFPEKMRVSAETLPREEWWRWNGLDVHLDRSPLASSPLKILVLHGAGAYGRVMSPAAVLARANGYETVAPDLPGYGLTAVEAKRMTYDLWIDCAVDLIRAELARDARPLVIFGVSLGGLLAYQAAAKFARTATPEERARLVGLIASTLADTREPEVREGFARTRLLGKFGLKLLDGAAPLLDGLPLPMRYMSKMDRISNNPELAALCSRDPLGGNSWVPARFLRTLMHAAPAIEPEQFGLCPVLLVHPGADRMTEIAHSRRFFDRLACAKRMVVLEGASHMPTEQPGVDQLERAVLQFLAPLGVRSAA